MIEYVTIVPASEDRVRSDTASVLECPDGELFIVYHSYSSGPGGNGDFGAARIYRMRSRDRGRSWKGERHIAEGDLNVMSPYLCAVDGSVWRHCGEYRLQGGTSSMIRLADGRFLVPFQSTPEVWVQNENEYVGSSVSDDGGLHWRESKNHVRLPMRGAMEPSAAELADGPLLMSLRTQLGSVFFTEATDRGEHWSLARASGVRSPESCTCLRRIPGSDRLVLFRNDADYLPDHHHFGIRTPLSAAVSDDAGVTFRKIGDSETGDGMYTNLGCTFLSTGEAFLTYLAGPDAEVRGCRYAAAVTDPAKKGEHRRFELNAAIIPSEWFEQ